MANPEVTGPGGKQILIKDPARNVAKLLRPAARSRPVA